MKTLFYTILCSDYKHHIEFDLFTKGFKRFHPDIELKVVDENIIDELRKTKPWINLLNCKASIAKLFYNDYDLVVNIDADHFIFDRLDEILIGDYDVAAPANYNLYENVGIKITTYLNNIYEIVPETQYIQGGLIASTSKRFWDVYELASFRYSNSFACKENDTLNLVMCFNNFKFKFLDGHFDYRDPKFKCFYGCSSLNQEKNVIVFNNKLYLNDKPMKCYHVAKGGGKPKMVDIFIPNVVDWYKKEITYGI